MKRPYEQNGVAIVKIYGNDQKFCITPAELFRRGIEIADSTYLEYVQNCKLHPIVLGKIHFYFYRDLAKSLMTPMRNGKS